MAAADDTRMNVLVSVNDSYVMPLAVMLGSLLKTNDAAQVTVWLLHLGLSEASLDAVRGVVEGPGAELVAVPLDDALFEGYPTANYISKETYLRLLAGEVLPPELHRILWLDADMLVRGSLDELYRADFGDNALVACGHGEDLPGSMREHCEELGMAPNEYINAGMLLINLDAWRALDLRAKAEELVQLGIKLSYADQDMVNLIFGGRIALVDDRVYNLRTNQPFSPEQLAEARSQARIIHYCGVRKPWALSDLQLSDLWRDAYAQSPFGAKKLRLISSVGLSRMMGKFKEQTGR